MYSMHPKETTNIVKWRVMAKKSKKGEKMEV